MAARTGAGTGVIVSLVVFILTTVFLLVMTIVFYSGREKAFEDAAKADKDLVKYVSKAELNSERVKLREGSASRDRKSVLGFTLDELGDVMSYVGGRNSMSLEQLRTEMSTAGITPDEPVVDQVKRLRRSLTETNREVGDKDARLQDMQSQVDQLNARLQDAERTADERVAEVESNYERYIRTVEDYGNQVRQVVGQYNTAIETHENTYRTRINSLEQDKDSLGRTIVLLQTRLDELERLRAGIIQKVQDPSQLVDGEIIDVIGANQEVFINLGRRHRIVLGMTFEVYQEQVNVGVDPRTGELTRGKATIRVIKVGETTSTCTVIRSIPSQPIVKRDLIVNAVYDPDYKFKFLIHGKFDVNGDGRATDREATLLRGLVRDWGGIVIEGEQIPGDLDYLVLGIEPPEPAPPGINLTDEELQAWSAKREARAVYKELQLQAREAQIPVLNANRFFILIGHYPR